MSGFESFAGFLTAPALRPSALQLHLCREAALFNWAGFVRPETDQLDSGTNSTFDLKSLLANQKGPLPGDRTHSIKGFASKTCMLPANISLSSQGWAGLPNQQRLRHHFDG